MADENSRVPGDAAAVAGPDATPGRREGRRVAL